MTTVESVGSDRNTQACIVTTETLLAIIAPIWVLLLVGLWRLAGRIEHIDRRISESLDRLGPRHG